MGRSACDLHVRPCPVDFWRAFRMRSIQAEHGNVSRLLLPLLLSGRLIDIHGKPPLPTDLRRTARAGAVATAAAARAVRVSGMGRCRVPNTYQPKHHLSNRRNAGRSRWQPGHPWRRLDADVVCKPEEEPGHRARDPGQDQPRLLWRQRAIHELPRRPRPYRRWASGNGFVHRLLRAVLLF